VTKRVAIVDGALACIAAKGLRATTVDDVARASGMSRATLYRTIPGGRDAIIQATAETEVARFFSALAVAMGAATTLEAALVSGITTSARWISDSAALTTLLEVEPWVIMRHISFGQMDRALTLAVDFSGPFFGRWLEPEQAARAADWAVRIVTSYLVSPSEAIDLTDVDQVRQLVRQFVLPGVEALQERGSA
jgi:AcrR family transcriptional regulator